MKMHITIPEGSVRNDFLPERVRRLISENFDVTYNELGRNYTQEELYQACSDADIVVTGWGTPSFIGGPIRENHSIKLIAHTAGSVADLLDDEVYEHGIKVVSGNKLFAQSVAEGTVAYMTSMLRRIPDDINEMRDGVLWKGESDIVTRGLIDRDIGIVGFGMITRYLLEMLKPYNCNIKIFSQHPMDEEFLKLYNATPASLEEVFSSSVVSVHSSLNDSTRDLIGKELLNLMPEDAIFINTARGAIVKEDELIEVLESKKIYAVLDVYRVEPPALDSPLRKLKNVYTLPHRAGPTNDRRPWIGLRVIEDAIRFSRGEELEFEIPRYYAKRMTRHSK